MSRVPIPTKEEIDEAVRLDREVVAVSAIQNGPVAYMKFAFSNGEASTVSLGTVGAFNLIEALKTLYPKHEQRPASPVQSRKTETGGLEIQSGHTSDR
jgi:hypothetical protein